MLLIRKCILENGLLMSPPKQYSLDMGKVKASIGKSSSFDFDIMLGGHGQALVPNA
jgi:hypothetical protein